MKTLHNKDLLYSSYNQNTLIGIRMYGKLQIPSTNTHTHKIIESWNQIKLLSCRIFLLLLLMLAGKGSLFSQTAESPCDCSSWTVKGITGQRKLISDLGTIPNCTYFKGTIVINQTTTWNQLSIRMETGSSIDVRSTLAISECNIGTCDDLWEGIYTVGGSSFVYFNKSIIRGANIAIRLNDQAVYHIQNSLFVDNYIGIATGSPFEEDPIDAVVYPSEKIILGCQFYTESHLPDPYPWHFYYPAWPSSPGIPFNQGYAALYIVGSTGLDIGKLDPGSNERNLIYNMRNGVIVKGSTTKILGTDFKFFEGSVPKLAVVGGLLYYNQRGISVEGSVCHIEQDTFKNVMIGVHSTRSSQNILDNYFNIPIQSPIGVTRGITIDQPQKTHIAQNKIYNGYMGINVTVSWNTELKIEENNLFRWLSTENNVGINLEKVYGLHLSNVVRENELDITGGKKAVGISMNQVNELLLFHNTVDFLQTELLTAGTENAGISGMQVYNSLIAENYINGTANYQSGSKNAGIIMTNSMANDLNCNEMDEMYYGQWIVGANMQTDLKSNEFYNATHGLDLFSPVTLGPQEHFANKWVGSYSAYGAYISGPDPINTAFNSSFIADGDASPGGIFIPSSIGPFSVEDDWFFDVDGVANGVPCTDYGEFPLTDTLVYVVRHALEFTDYEDEMNWMRKADLLTFLHLYPAYLANTVLDSFYDAESNTALGELIMGQYQMSKFHGMDPDMPEKDSLVFTYLSQVRVLDSLIELNSINLGTLKALRLLKIDTLSGHISDWKGMLDSQIADTEVQMADALDLVSYVSPTNDQETSLQAVLLLQGVRSLGDTLTTAELSDVYTQARQCPWLGARSLSEAQILYSQVADSIFTHRPGACFQSESFFLEERSDDPDDINEINIYPNPTAEIIHLQLPAWVEVVEISSLEGKLWRQLETPEGGQYEIEVSDIPSGMYLIELQGGTKTETRQIFITK